jgi:hypothetical protein
MIKGNESDREIGIWLSSVVQRVKIGKMKEKQEIKEKAEIN